MFRGLRSNKDCDVMLNLSFRLLSGGLLLMCCLSACIPVPMPKPELYRPLTDFTPQDGVYDFESQQARFNVAIDDNPRDADARFARALLYMGVGRYASAEEDLTIAIQVAEKQSGYDAERLATIYVHRGLIRWSDEKVELAIDDYSRAIELAPKNWEGYFHRWLAYHFEGEEEKAEQDRQRGMKLEPDVFDREYVLRYDGIVL